MIVKLMKLKLDERMAGIEETRNTYNIFVRKHREKKFTWKTEETRWALWR
jgi:hypothetical protein